MDANSVIEARRKAEQAVADMPEGDLKIKAFEVILNRLLSVSSDAGEPAPSAKRKRQQSQPTQDANPEAETDTIPRSTSARILSLKKDSFFAQPRGIGEIREELQTHGWIYEVTALSGTLIDLVQSRDLRRAKVTDGSKTVYKYFNP